MKFKYKIYGSTSRPVIESTLKYKNNSIRYEVLIDSGADICLFDQSVGEAIGIDVKMGKVRELFGVGGKASLYYLHPVTIKVGKWEFKIEAGFMPDVSGKVMPYGIVGQKGFFENFIVKFNLSKGEIELKQR
ncbi:MAG: retropepsin-like aspartic protease [bacterium]|nr:retropepsin-like aspartic protease [bacterium]